ncbi:XamI family restriction endonuclease [Arcanobacterium buesumense]|uniref:XamI family restriction endonuclease n=2 Tax=Arcanobacterium buesumense TaxID=2722751 RepID=A0A6H2ELJ2_9ACTO|nr:XamI family restriction endonuclease [Arcanobacterium buesumense]
MVTAPTIARDRFVVLANVPRSLVEGLEEEHLSSRMSDAVHCQNLNKIIAIIIELLVDPF